MYKELAKVIRVYNSCETQEQLKVARKMSGLFFSQFRSPDIYNYCLKEYKEAREAAHKRCNVMLVKHINLGVQK